MSLSLRHDVTYQETLQASLVPLCAAVRSKLAMAVVLATAFLAPAAMAQDGARGSSMLQMSSADVGANGKRFIAETMNAANTPEAFVQSLYAISSYMLDHPTWITHPDDRIVIQSSIFKALEKFWPQRMPTTHPDVPIVAKSWNRINHSLPKEKQDLQFQDEKTENELSLKDIVSGMSLATVQEYVAKHPTATFSIITNHPQFIEITSLFADRIVVVVLSNQEEEFDATPYPKLHAVDLSGHVKKLKLTRPIKLIDFKQTHFIDPRQISGLEHLTERQKADIVSNLFDIIFSAKPKDVQGHITAKSFFNGTYDWAGLDFPGVLLQFLEKQKINVSLHFLAALMQYPQISPEVIQAVSQQVHINGKDASPWEFYDILRASIGNRALDLAVRQRLLLRWGEIADETTDNRFLQEYDRIAQSSPELITGAVRHKYEQQKQFITEEHPKRRLENEHGLQMRHIQDAPRTDLEHVRLVVHPFYALAQIAMNAQHGNAAIDYAELHDPALVYKLLEKQLIGWFNRVKRNIESADADHQIMGTRHTFIAIDLFEEWQFLHDLPQDGTVVFALPKGVPLSWEFPDEQDPQRQVKNTADERQQFLFNRNIVAILKALQPTVQHFPQYYVETKSPWSGPLFPQDAAVLNEYAQRITLSGGYVNRCVEQAAGDLDPTKVVIDGRNISNAPYASDLEKIPADIQDAARRIPRPLFASMDDVAQWYASPEVQEFVQRYHTWHTGEFRDVLTGVYGEK